MAISQKDIKEIELVGKTEDGDEIYHLQTKGGFHKMLRKKKNGSFDVLGYGNHRAVARVMANEMLKNILWHESLFKSEDLEILKKYEEAKKVLPESTPQAHTEQAVWHSYMASKSDPVNQIYHTLNSIAHFQAAGLDKSKALQVFNETFKKLKKTEKYTMDQPYNEALLKMAWEQKNKKPFPEGEFE